MICCMSKLHTVSAKRFSENLQIHEIQAQAISIEASDLVRQGFYLNDSAVIFESGFQWLIVILKKISCGM